MSITLFIGVFFKQIRSKEIGICDRNTILRKDGKSFNFALEYYNQVRPK